MKTKRKVVKKDNKLASVMYLDKACLSIPLDIDTVWIFRGNEQYVFTLPTKPKNR